MAQVHNSHNSDVCRLCLAFDLHLILISGSLQIVYEKLTTTPLCTSDGRPVAACYICHAQLKKCYKLMLTAVRAEHVFTSILASKTKVTKSSVSQFNGHGIMPFGELTLSKLKRIDVEVGSTISSPGDIKIQPRLPLVEHVKIEIDEECEGPSQSSISEILKNHDKKESSIEKTISTMHISKTQPVDAVVSVEIKREMEDDNTPAQQNPGPEPIEGMIVCPYCQRRFLIGSDFVAHIRMHRDGVPIEVINSTPLNPPPPPPNPDDSLINCKYCDRKFKFASDFDRHLRMHTGERPYSCNLCDLRFKLQSHLKRHSKTHTDDKPHKCDTCQRTFNEISSLKRHFRYHTGEKPYECSVCRRRFSELSSMKRHMKTHTGEKTAKCHECDVCQRRFVDIDRLKRHASIHKPFKCNDCKLEFYTNYSLQMHLKTHLIKTYKKFQCNFCHFSFSHISNYKRHLTVHSEIHFECDNCQHRFHNKSQLKRHLKEHD